MATDEEIARELHAAYEDVRENVSLPSTLYTRVYNALARVRADERERCEMEHHEAITVDDIAWSDALARKVTDAMPMLTSALFDAIGSAIRDGIERGARDERRACADAANYVSGDETAQRIVAAIRARGPVTP